VAVDALTQIILDAAEQIGAALTLTQAEQLREYAELVAKWQRIVNLTSADTPTSFAREHIVDCLSVLPFVNGPRVIDVGTGAGLPGLVLAIALPDLALNLIEPHGKRARFLTQVKINLRLSNVEIICDRVEKHRPTELYDSIIARAFGSFSRLFAETMNLRRPGTRLIAMKGAVDPQEIATNDLSRHTLRIAALDVPGFSDRNLVIVDFGG
jgi:16S rRNA (guanine527-N7)-methyltransferase